MKGLTSGNWLQPDPLSLAFSNVHDLATGETREMSVEEFLSYVLEPELSMTVPDTVRTLFEGARGALTYGYYFYPLFMVGAEQLFRVAEAAGRDRAEQLNAPKSQTFNDNIRFLIARRMIAESDQERWDAFRMLRNQASHPRYQQIMPPGPTISLLPEIAAAINQLFASA